MRRKYSICYAIHAILWAGFLGFTRIYNWLYLGGVQTNFDLYCMYSAISKVQNNCQIVVKKSSSNRVQLCLPSHAHFTVTNARSTSIRY